MAKKKKRRHKGGASGKVRGGPAEVQAQEESEAPQSAQAQDRAQAANSAAAPDDAEAPEGALVEWTKSLVVAAVLFFFFSAMPKIGFQTLLQGLVAEEALIPIKLHGKYILELSGRVAEE